MSFMHLHDKIEEYLQRLPGQDKDIAVFVRHLLDALHEEEQQHRLLTASNALSGIKPDPIEEKTFIEDTTSFKQLILRELEKTTEDLEHLGDKYWTKHYKDGVKSSPKNVRPNSL